MPRNDWNQYKQLFIHEMKENGEHFKHIAETLDSLRADVAAVKVDIGGLKIKAAVAGGAAGVVGTAVLSFIVKLLG